MTQARVMLARERKDWDVNGGVGGGSNGICQTSTYRVGDCSHRRSREGGSPESCSGYPLGRERRLQQGATDSRADYWPSGSDHTANSLPPGSTK